MYCNTSLALLSIPPRLPRTLVLLLSLSFLWQTGSSQTLTLQERLPPPTLVCSQWRRRRAGPAGRSPRSRRLGFVYQTLPRVLARSLLLAVLLYAQGGPLPSVVNLLLLLPALQGLAAGLALVAPQRVRTPAYSRWASRLQRLYQLTLLALLLGMFVRLGRAVPTHGLLGPLLVGGWVLHPNDATEVSVTSTAENHYAVTLRGAFTLVWEPRDAFERWMLVLFLRQFHQSDAVHPLLSRAQVGQAFDLRSDQVWRWEHEVLQLCGLRVFWTG